MEIRLYRPPGAAERKITPLAIFKAAVTVSFTENHFTFGRFEFTLPGSVYGAEMLEKYLFVNIGGEFWGIILSLTREITQQGYMLTASGLDLKGLMSSRYTLPPAFSDAALSGTAGYDAITGTTETCMKHFVRSNFFTSASPTRTVPGLVIAPDLGRGVSDDKYMTRYDLLSDVLEKLAEAAELGYTVTPNLDTGEIIFDCVKGVDRSAAQSDTPPIIFEILRGNIASMNYQDSDDSMRNLFYATLSGARFADEAYTAAYTRNDEPLPEGIRRWEQHLEISATHPVAGQEYAELKRLALVRAESYATATSFTANVIDVREHYGSAYRLGDIVTVQNADWGLGMNARITASAVQASAAGVTRTLTFGKAPINPLAKIRRQIRGG